MSAAAPSPRGQMMSPAAGTGMPMQGGMPPMQGGVQDPCRGMGMAGLCLEPQQEQMQPSFQYVGEGRGQYEQVPTYNFVGEGAGSWTQDEIPVPGGAGRWRCQFCLVLTLALLIVAGACAWMEHWLDGEGPAGAPSEEAPAAGDGASWQTAPNFTDQEVAEAGEVLLGGAAAGSPGEELPANETLAIESFDCDKDYAAWESEWSMEKRLWCCERKQRACDSATTTPTEEYDCIKGFHAWRRSWEAAQQAWCCEHHNKACETSTTTPKPKPHHGRRSHGHHEANKSAHKSNQSQDGWDCSVDAAISWPKEKRIWCCLQEAKGCPDVPAAPKITTAPPLSDQALTTSSSPADGANLTGCDAVCTFNSKSFSCGARILYTREHKAAGAARPCMTARDIVLEDCPGCSTCALRDAGCQDGTIARVAPAPKPALEKNVKPLSPLRPVTGGTPGGPPPPFAAPTAPGVNATASHSSNSSSPPANASAGNKSAPEASTRTTAAAKATSAPAASEDFDCTAEPLSEWSDAKIRWCCDNKDKGCAGTTTAAAGPVKLQDDLDCKVGYFEWKTVWSAKKKIYCCEHETLGCPEDEGARSH